MSFIPLALSVTAALLLRMGSRHLGTLLQVWAIYMFISSGLKLLGAYMQSKGNITYDWTTWSLYRNVFFIIMALFFLFISKYFYQTDNIENVDAENQVNQDNVG